MAEPTTCEEPPSPSYMHMVTPLVHSPPISERLQHPVLLKLDLLQPSGSFKIRGLGHMAKKAKENGSSALVSSSGGNAGLAVAYAGQVLKMDTTVVVPETTPEFVRERIRHFGAKVVVHGKVWNDADVRAREIVAQENATYMPPFDHPDIWEGNSTIVDEIKEGLRGVKPACIAVSVGGGGLMLGVLQGLAAAGWDDVPVVAMETEGANKFGAALKAGHAITLPGITSIAKSLGALRIAEKAMEWPAKHKIVSGIVSDKQAVSAMLHLLDDQHLLVEPACGTTLACVYEGREYLESLLPGVFDDKSRPIVAVVCGGSAVTFDALAKWKAQFEL